MISLVGLLLVISGTVLAVPPIYQVLSYITYNGNPIVPMALGVACILVGLIFLIYRPRQKKGFVEVG
jgi:dipeptide/tripeptide permease